ncbi:hypothetical protein GGF46_004605 [Coemansia sp. RSA 552]|nr:hypothetical protein GGF46_004605 [Coemansia sp. RSA 552]
MSAIKFDKTTFPDYDRLNLMLEQSIHSLQNWYDCLKFMQTDECLYRLGYGALYEHVIVELRIDSEHNVSSKSNIDMFRGSNDFWRARAFLVYIPSNEGVEYRGLNLYRGVLIEVWRMLGAVHFMDNSVMGMGLPPSELVVIAELVMGAMPNVCGIYIETLDVGVVPDSPAKTVVGYNLAYPYAGEYPEPHRRGFMCVSQMIGLSGGCVADIQGPGGTLSATGIWKMSLGTLVFKKWMEAVVSASVPAIQKPKYPYVLFCFLDCKLIRYGLPSVFTVIQVAPK